MLYQENYPIIRAMNSKSGTFSPYTKKRQTTTSNKPYHNTTPFKNADTSFRCKQCGQLGHDETIDSGYFTLAKYPLCKQASERLAATQIQDNTKKHLNKMSQKNKDRKKENLCKNRSESYKI